MATFGKSLIMAMKWILCWKTKLEMIRWCGVGSLPKSEIGMQYGLTSSTLFLILKKNKI
jgi:hypothetical protein